MNHICTLNIPAELIVLISGVPGVGKTTISYELFKRYNEFRIIQETDIIREILRGYNEYIENTTESMNTLKEIQEKFLIPDHRKIFNYSELKTQCFIMKKSMENIIIRQQRKGIPSILNGVHIVPEVLNGILENENIIYINLFINKKDILRSRLSGRDEHKYMPYLDVSFETNCLLYASTLELSKNNPHIFKNIDVTDLTVDQVLKEVVGFIELNFA